MVGAQEMIVGPWAMSAMKIEVVVAAEKCE
jgi:hypothetical protein